MSLLSMFLTDDVGPYDGPDHWIEWIRESPREETSSNYCSLEKRQGYLMLGCIHDQNPDDLKAKIPTKQLIYVLEQWKQVWEHKPYEVIITRENDIYQVIQKSNDMSQA